MITSSMGYNKKTIESQMYEEVFKGSYYSGDESFNNICKFNK